VIGETGLQTSASNPGALLIRADANSVIGTGHVMRCLALAQAWQDVGGTVTFACARLTDSLSRRLTAEGCAVETLTPSAQGTWDDLNATRALAESIGPRWLVLDGYAFGPTFQLALREVKWRLMVIDDDGRRTDYYADVLLNQNAGAAAALYGRHTHTARLLLGSRYAMLRREFLRTPRKLATSETVARILLTLGGADAHNLTQRFLDVLAPCVPADSQIHVLVGPANPHVAALQELASTMKRMVLHVAPDNVPQIMADCDLAITAAGSSVYELAYLGVPMLFVVTAENQRPIAAALDQLGAGVRIDELPTSRTADLPSAFERLAADAALRAQCAATCRQLVDGQGAARVVAVLREMSGGQ
jgi:UDP-2,4-diacetamido-2,4,6-trideoxy-beta-L-altropyranose hydrolase